VNSATTDTSTTTAVQLNTVSKLYKQWNNSIVPAVQQKCSGSGYWDPQVAYINKTGEVAVLASMTSPTINNPVTNSRMQVGVGLMKMTETGLQEVTPLTQFTNLQGQRPFMRPTLAYGNINDESKKFILALGASEDIATIRNGNPQVAAYILDAKTGKTLTITNAARDLVGATPRVAVTDVPDNLVAKAVATTNVNKTNQHGPHSVCALPPAPDGTQSFIVGVQQNNAQAQLMRVDVKRTSATTATVDVPYLKTIENNARHNRVSLACPLNGYAGASVVAVSVKANQQPADIGIEAMMVNTADGTVTSRKLIAASDKANRIHAVQPTAAYINDNVFAVQYVMAQAKGPGGNNNGHAQNTIAQKSMLATFKVGTFDQVDKLEGPAAYQRHPSAFGTLYGAGEGSPAVSILSGSSTGTGPGIQQIIPVSADGKLSAASARNMYEISKFSDVGDNCAKNMKNPGEGRCFLNGIGGVENPGFGKANGFMPEVKTFTLTAVGAKAQAQDNRLSLFVNLTPSTWDPSIKSTSPGSAKDPSEVANGPSPKVNVNTKSDPTTFPGPGPEAEDPAVGEDENLVQDYKTRGVEASACSVKAAGTGATNAAGFSLIGLGLALLSIRRKKGH
jgi:hypothetical protein